MRAVASAWMACRVLTLRMEIFHLSIHVSIYASMQFRQPLMHAVPMAIGMDPELQAFKGSIEAFS